MSRPLRHAIDFDGTLSHYDGWKGHRHTGAPVPLMLEKVKGWLLKGDEVFILTARITPWKHADVPALGQVDVEEARKVVEDWTEQHVGQRLEVTNIKGGFDDFWDDNVRQVIKNTGMTVQEYVVQLLQVAAADIRNNRHVDIGLVMRRLIAKVEALQ